ncbi:NFACT family protein [Candidatus Woesearchaeota archaeon]|nr:NFACT family protein [Candidatus Woesearchaeota archaeon]
MKTVIASIELRALVEELQVLINAKLDKIYQPEKTEFFFQFHVPNIGRKILRISIPNFMYITGYKPGSQKPSPFCMYLRKNLSNTRLREINQKGFERIVEFIFEKKQKDKIEHYSIIVELFGTGNLLLLKDNTILSALFYHKWKDRTIRPKELYDYPKKSYNPLNISKTSLKEFLKKTDKESIVKALAIDFGFGGTYAEEICLLAGIDKNKKPNQIKSLDKLLNAIISLKKLKPKGYIYPRNEIVPYELNTFKSLRKSEFQSFNEALDSIFTKNLSSKVNDEKKSKYQKKLDKINKILNNQKSTIDKLKESEKLSKQKAELIYNNYTLLKDLLNQIAKAKKQYDWNFIKENLQKVKQIKSINIKDKKITIELK